MFKRILLWIATVFIAAFIIFTAEAILTQKSLSDKTLRLHIVANSDDPKDQAQKLLLRDHILREIHSMTEKCVDLKEAEDVLRSALPQLQAVSKEFLLGEGCNYQVSVSLCSENFDTRQYDTFSLPAGEYHSLKIILGEGQGKNWWCVVFPTLCNASTMEELSCAAQAGAYDMEELAFIRREEPKYKLQFKVLEWISAVFD